MMQILGGLGDPQKPLKKPSVPWGFVAGTRANFGLVLEWGPGGPLEKRRSNMVQ